MLFRSEHQARHQSGDERASDDQRDVGRVGFSRQARWFGDRVPRPEGCLGRVELDLHVLPPAEREALVTRIRAKLRSKLPIFAVSAATGQGCAPLMQAVDARLRELATAEREPA